MPTSTLSRKRLAPAHVALGTDPAELLRVKLPIRKLAVAVQRGIQEMTKTKGVPGIKPPLSVVYGQYMAKGLLQGVQELGITLPPKLVDEINAAIADAGEDPTD
jgi:hypothetical protein